MGYKWISCGHNKTFVPPKAVKGGSDDDGCMVYVGRTHFHGDKMAAKIVPKRGQAFVAYKGKEHEVHDFDILVETKLAWIPASHGIIPEGTVETGFAENGEKLYVGRVKHNGADIIGKIHPSHHCIYIPCAGDELSFPHYEALIEQ